MTPLEVNEKIAEVKGLEINNNFEHASKTTNQTKPHQQGWECPKCGSVYAPFMPACTKCGKESK